MRLFQNSGLYGNYVPRLRALTQGISGFESLREVFLHDRFGAAHFLLPVLQHDESAFFTNGDDEMLQRAWAKENGMPSASTMEDILRAQLEAHRATVLYNLDPLRYGGAFLRTLPGCVRHTLAWRAAPSGNADLSGYDLVVCNFPDILREFEKRGCRTAFFSPAHDPVMDEYAGNENRPIDILFAGSYSRHHLRRARILQAISRLANKYNVALHLDQSRATRLAESMVGKLLPLGRYRRPAAVRSMSQPPVFGRELYLALSKSKIVINVAIDMAGNERGNMRCWEAMGLRCLMFSDSGSYPHGMSPGESFVTYDSENEVPQILAQILSQWDRFRQIAERGYSVVRESYSKQVQMKAFESMIAAIS